MCRKPLQEGWLKIDHELHQFVNTELCPQSGINPINFWAALATIVDQFGAENSRLLARRGVLQAQIDNWFIERGPGQPTAREHREFLEEIGYLVPDGPDFSVNTSNIDPEIASIAGPQLVVPADNARYALNAANARWGSLYDALYGTDAISDRPDPGRDGIYNPERGALVVKRVADFLDEAFPLASGSHADVREYRLLKLANGLELRARIGAGDETNLRDATAIAGYQGTPEAPTAILLRHNQLHVEMQIDRDHPIGATHPAGLKDVLLESAISAIQDCEDSVATVDASDKLVVYRNWLGLMRGDLEASFDKNGRPQTRQLAPDRDYQAADGGAFSLPGRSLMMVRNVGMHLYTDAVLTSDDQPIPEGFLDALVTVLAAKHDLLGNGRYRNSRSGSIYVVKPKLHGPEEVAFTCRVFAAIERMLSIEPGTVKLGIMDEERRTSLNLRECIRAAAERIFFVNTGFLDRTADELHTMMNAGAALPKPDIKRAAWIEAYEQGNVDIALAAGMAGHAQIGKGMWAEPDEMAAMLATKAQHPLAGATTAWVPSPTAATLHALHYHQVNVSARQQALRQQPPANRDALLTMPLMENRKLSAAEIQQELDNNAQGILGYVVRWVELGMGCSKVPDIHDIGLMEDRATLRISSQHIANWLRAGIVCRSQVTETFRRMAAVVDQQNANVPNYRPMAGSFDQSLGFQAALDLVFTGCDQPNGYTEAVLQRRRRQFKAAALQDLSRFAAAVGH